MKRFVGILIAAVALLIALPVAAQDPDFDIVIYEGEVSCSSPGSATVVEPDEPGVWTLTSYWDQGCCSTQRWTWCETNADGSFPINTFFPYTATVHLEYYGTTEGYGDGAYDVDSILEVPYETNIEGHFGSKSENTDGPAIGYGDVTGSIDRTSDGQTQEADIIHAFNGSAYLTTTLSVSELMAPVAPPPPNYCPDGTEALTETVTIARYDSWTTSLTTTHDGLRVRYVVSRTAGQSPSYLHGTGSINGVSETFNQATDMLTVTVPSDYGVDGPTANLEVSNIGGSGDLQEFDLVSACVITATSFSHCAPGETEILTSPLQMEQWDRYIGSGSTVWDEFAITFWITDYRFPDAYITVNDNNQLLMRDSTGSGGDPIAWTLPISPSINGGYEGPDITYDIRNAGAYDFTLASVCISETERIEAPVNCHLINHDFITDTHGWNLGTGSSLSWVAESTGAAEVVPGGALSLATLQQDITDNLNGYYEVSARVRSSNVSTNTVSVGFPGSDSLGRTITVATSYETVAFDFLLGYPELFSLQTNHDTLIVDWVCIEQSSLDNWRLPIGECQFPPFDDHPALSLDSLPDWVLWIAEKVGELFVWALCELERLLYRVANVIMDVLLGAKDTIGLPDLPDDVSIGSLVTWLKEVYRSFGFWLGESLQNILLSGRTIGEWARDQTLTMAEWFWEDIFLEVIDWLMDQAVAAGLIGERTAADIRMLFRNFGMFFFALGQEMGFELQSAAKLLGEILDVFGVLIIGIRSSFTGTDQLDMGEGMGGFAAYLWRGVEFINAVVESTPLAGLNIVALGAIAWGLSTWTLHRFWKIIEYLASFGS